MPLVWTEVHSRCFTRSCRYSYSAIASGMSSASFLLPCPAHDVLGVCADESETVPASWQTVPCPVAWCMLIPPGCCWSERFLSTIRTSVPRLWPEGVSRLHGAACCCMSAVFGSVVLLVDKAVQCPSCSMMELCCCSAPGHLCNTQPAQQRVAAMPVRDMAASFPCAGTASL